MGPIRGVIGKILAWLATVASWVFSIPTLISPLWTIDRFIILMFLPFGAVELFYIYLEGGRGQVWPVPELRYYIPWVPLIATPETRWLVETRLQIGGKWWGTVITIMRPLLFAFGIIFFSVALFQFVSAKLKGVKLIKGGLYSVVRHPQYLGIVIFTFGLVLYGLRPADFLAWVILTTLYLLLAFREEKQLLKTLGEEYKTYKDSVPFILPRAKKQLNAQKPLKTLLPGNR